MNKKIKIVFSVLLLIAVMWLSVLFVDMNKLSVLNPKGIIALKEYRLIVISTLMMLIVVVPVFILTVYFAWKYRADNRKQNIDLMSIRIT